MSQPTLLQSLVGEWRGTVRTWVDPARPPVSNDISGTFRLLLASKTVIHEYTSRVGDARSDGMMLLGRDIETTRPSLAWVDTFHTGGDMMHLAADPASTDDRLVFAGAWAAGEETWRW